MLARDIRFLVASCRMPSVFLKKNVATTSVLCKNQAGKYTVSFLHWLLSYSFSLCLSRGRSTKIGIGSGRHFFEQVITSLKLGYFVFEFGAGVYRPKSPNQPYA